MGEVGGVEVTSVAGRVVGWLTIGTVVLPVSGRAAGVAGRIRRTLRGEMAWRRARVRMQRVHCKGEYMFASAFW